MEQRGSDGARVALERLRRYRCIGAGQCVSGGPAGEAGACSRRACGSAAATRFVLIDTIGKMGELTHYRKGSEVAMVDVSAKPATTRTAIAHGFVRMSAATLRAIRRRDKPKGNTL